MAGGLGGHDVAVVRADQLQGESDALLAWLLDVAGSVSQEGDADSDGPGDRTQPTHGADGLKPGMTATRPATAVPSPRRKSQRGRVRARQVAPVWRRTQSPPTISLPPPVPLATVSTAAHTVAARAGSPRAGGCSQGLRPDDRER